MTCCSMYIIIHCSYSHPPLYFLSPSALTIVCDAHTWRQEVNLVSSSMAHHFTFETGSVTESEGHKWLDWPTSPGDPPASTSQEDCRPTTHHISFFFFYDSSGHPNSGPQACGSLYSLGHLPAFTYSLDSAHEMTHNLSFSPPSPSLVSSSPLLSLPSRLRVLNELFDMHHPHLPFGFLRQVSLCSPGRSGTWERSTCLSP